MSSVVRYVLIRTIIMIFGIIAVIVIIYRKKPIVRWDRYPKEKQTSVRKIAVKADRIIYVIMAAMALFMFVYGVIPAALDIPAAIKKEYKSISGTVVGWSLARKERRELRGVRIEDEKTKEIKYIYVVTYGIHQGDYMNVTYLPHTRVGLIEEHITYEE